MLSASEELTRHRISNRTEGRVSLQIAKPSPVKPCDYGTVKIFPEYGSLTLLPEG